MNYESYLGFLIFTSDSGLLYDVLPKPQRLVIFLILDITKNFSKLNTWFPLETDYSRSNLPSLLKCCAINISIVKPSLSSCFLGRLC